MNLATSRLALLALCFATGGLSPACNAKERPPALLERDRGYADALAGDLDLSLTLPSQVTFTTVDYLLIGRASGARIEGSIELTDDAASAFVAGLAADTYSVFLTATLSTGTQCTGTTSVQVVANQTVPIHIVLSCGGSTNNQGAVNLGATIDEASCGFETVSVTPTRVVGMAPIALHATATSTVSAVTYRWSGPGKFTAPDSADTVYTCSLALGTQHIEIAVSDISGCEQRVGVDVDCLPETQCGDGQQQQGEACDDANLLDNDGCSARCTPELCGDGIVQPALGESCDPPGVAHCSDTCVAPTAMPVPDSATDVGVPVLEPQLPDAGPDDAQTTPGATNEPLDAAAEDAQLDLSDAQSACAACSDADPGDR